LPFKDHTRHLRDIFESIEHIEHFIGEMNFYDYRIDRKTRSAVERELQIITEAAVRLGPDWKGFRGMGNILRHAYHRIDAKIVWDTVKQELPPMRYAIRKALASAP